MSQAVGTVHDMRIIHTSDWHLGRQFGPVSLRADQEAFTDWFVELCRDERADLVVIAGDIYDRAIAPVESIELFRDTVRRLLHDGTAVAAITGNHDGADRVAPHGDLLDLSGFYLRGGYDAVGGVIRIDASDGPLDLVLLPFLDPQAAPDGFGEPATATSGPDADAEHVDVEELVDRRRRRTHHSVLDTATQEAASRLTAPRSVAVAHAFVSGGAVSESERQLVVGGTGEVASSIFDPFSYTALGHLHRPQTVSDANVRYSGTPLAYSFSEDHEKSVVVVDMDPTGATEISTIRVDVGRQVCTITGTIDELLRETHSEGHDRFVRAILTDRDTVLDARAKLATVYPYVVEVRLQPAGRDPLAVTAPTDVADLQPIDAARRFWEASEGSPPDEDVDDILIAATNEAITGSAT